ncbi:hypothetical protein K505DRAFT_328948 [Melanomma pulvis-pyrius CBS 109.77]|uniref:Uncharacterized protein n=1 Tax=Melanomma pulvis-pyrius CBS 109.77 TaxID=1314802 RepID=A0A6A6WWF6_9PLEO|nr:hypothetical protein K505DRAFT_328948 [Melanomma pulvis-pyrius CBS 109.77]
MACAFTVSSLSLHSDCLETHPPFTTQARVFLINSLSSNCSEFRPSHSFNHPPLTATCLLASSGSQRPPSVAFLVSSCWPPETLLPLPPRFSGDVHSLLLASSGR